MKLISAAYLLLLPSNARAATAGIRGIRGRESEQAGRGLEQAEPPSPSNDSSVSPTLEAASSPAYNEYSPPKVSLIQFEDVSETTIRDSIPDGYYGLNWDKFWVYNSSWQPGTGFDYGAGKSKYAAFNNAPDGYPCSASSTMPISFFGFVATAVYRKDMNLLIESLDEKGNLIGSLNVTLYGPDRHNYIDLRGGAFDDIYQLRITPSGGTCVQKKEEFYTGDSDCADYYAIDEMLVYRDL